MERRGLSTPTGQRILTAAEIRRNEIGQPVPLKQFVREGWEVLEPETDYLHNWHVDCICDHLEAVTYGFLRRVMFNIPPRYMKPVEENALVLMVSGQRKPLHEVAVGDRVITHLGRSAAVTAIAVQGNLPVLKIVTDQGRTVRAAPDHPFLTPDGWLKAEDLRVGMTLANVVPTATPNCSAGPDEAFRMAGYIIGDGNTSGAGGGIGCQANVTCHDPSLMLDVRLCANILGWGAKEVNQRLNLSGGVRNWLREHNLDRKTSWTKRIPDFVFSGSKSQIGQFLGAYFACDGTMQRKGDHRRDCQFSFHSVNRPLLEDAQHLLLRLGIRSRIRTHRAKHNSFTGGPYESFVLTVSSQDDNAKFIDRVTVFGDKGERISNYRETLYRADFDPSLLPDRIVSIEPDGDAPCRCLSLDRDHSFTANDLVVHNSLLCSILWPCWEWTMFPGNKWMFATYSAELSEDQSVYRRNLLESEWFLTRWGHICALNPDMNLKTKFQNTKMGMMVATSVGGTATGKGANRIVIDDPHNPKQANSDIERQQAIDFFRGTLYSRMNDKKKDAIIGVMQRLHEDDLTGFLIDVFKEIPFTHVKIPGYCAHEDDTVIYAPKVEHHPDGSVTCDLRGNVYRRELGSLLWPEREDVEEMAGMREAMGEYQYAAQYDQDPAPKGGGIIKEEWWQYYRWAELPRDSLNQFQFDACILSVDCTFKDTKASDEVCIQVWGKKAADNFLLDEVCRRMSFSETLRMIAAMANRWPQAKVKLVEDKANGPAVIDSLKHEIPGLVAVNPEGGKEVRVHAVSYLIEAGNVYLPDAAERPRITKPFVHQFNQFPRGKRDDRVDSCSQALIRLNQRSGKRRFRVLTAA